jgi:hypothetical protein
LAHSFSCIKDTVTSVITEIEIKKSFIIIVKKYIYYFNIKQSLCCISGEAPDQASAEKKLGRLNPVKRWGEMWLQNIHLAF